MTDQIEIETYFSYDGSTNNDIFLRQKNQIYGVQNINSGSLLDYISSSFKQKIGSLANGLYNTSYSLNDSTVDIKFGFLNAVAPNQHNFNYPMFLSGGVKTYSQVDNIITRNNITRPKRNLKLFCIQETYYDSIMPDPMQIYNSGVLDPYRNFNVFWKCFGTNVSASYIMLSYGVVTNSLVYCGEDIGAHTIINNNGTYVPGNYKWAYQFPFQRDYKEIKRGTIDKFNPYVKSSTPFTFTGDDQKQLSFIATTDVGYGGPSTVFTPRISLGKTNKPDKWGMPISIVYFGTEQKAFESGSLMQLTKSLYYGFDVQLSNSNHLQNGDFMTSLDETSFLFHFFGFGSFMNKFVGGVKSYPGTNANGNAVYWNYNGNTSYLAGDPYANFSTYQYTVTSGAFVGYRCRGYKYGVYKPIPDYSTAVFRSNHYGQFRDILEQRQYTNYFGSIGTSNAQSILGAVVNVSFSSTSSYGVTSSTPSLNPKDSGIYDTQCRSGQPFFDDDTRV